MQFSLKLLSLLSFFSIPALGSMSKLPRFFMGKTIIKQQKILQTNLSQYKPFKTAPPTFLKKWVKSLQTFAPAFEAKPTWHAMIIGSHYLITQWELYSKLNK